MIELVRGSVTDQRVDAIVNAANTRMRGGGGVDGRIHELSGPRMLDELRRIAPRGSQVAEVFVTPGFALPHRYVIHVAGPIWRGGSAGEAEALAASYRNSLLAADTLGCQSVAFCSLSTGAFGYPLELAAPLAVQTLSETFADMKTVQRIVLAMFGQAEFEVFSRTLS